MNRSMFGAVICGSVEPHDVPAGEEGFQVFLGVGDETSGTIVPPTTGEEDAALDLYQRAALDTRKVHPPFALGVKDELPLEFRPAEAAPVEGEFRFEARGWPAGGIFSNIAP